MSEAVKGMTDMRIKGNKGFTLLEMVISVAALSLISVFIIQMFMASDNLNERARNADIALTVAISEIERVKGGEVLHSNTNYYNKNWMIVSENNARFMMEFIITPEPQMPGLYAISAEIFELASGEKERSLASLQTKKYFPAEVKANES